MNQTPPPPEQPVEGQQQTQPGALKSWVDWIQSVYWLCSNLSKLAVTEVHLAFIDLPRLIFVALLMLPILFLAWTGLFVLLAWLVSVATHSIAAGLITFLVSQLLTLFVLFRLLLKYKRSLGLPVTRAQLSALAEEIKSVTKNAER